MVIDEFSDSLLGCAEFTQCIIRGVLFLSTKNTKNTKKKFAPQNTQNTQKILFTDFIA